MAGKGRIAPGGDADLVAFAPEDSFTVDPARLHHRAPADPVRGPAAARRGAPDLAARRAGARPTARRAAADPRRSGRHDRASDFTSLPDLASRLLGGGVVAASDELFAEKENLVKPGAPVFAAEEYGNRGKVYDGWETARRREGGHDHAIVRLGVPGIVHGVVVDTAFFRGNYPPQISVEAVGAEGYPSPDELAVLDWQTLVPRAGAQGDTANAYPVADRRAVDPRPAVDLPGRRGGQVPGARRARCPIRGSWPAPSTWRRWSTAAGWSAARTRSTRRRRT